MDNRIIFPQSGTRQTGLSQASTAVSQNGTSSFQSILEQKLVGNVSFSRHAQERLKSRNIQLDDQDLARLNEAVSLARQKGARDSLILMNQLALVVSVKNNTVITAVDGQSLRDNVFTNIDSAIII